MATILGPVPGDPMTSDRSNDSKESGELDVNVLLKGAEKLCAVWSVYRYRGGLICHLLTDR